MRIAQLKDFVEIPQGFIVDIIGNTVSIKSEKGELNRSFKDPKVIVQKTDSKIEFISKNATKREKMRMGTYKAHINNMFIGVKDGFTYKLKICSGHFPMNVSLNGQTLSVKNFLGEKVARELTLKEGAQVKIEGDLIIVTSIDKERAGQVAASIEKLTKITGRDRRIFQDGIYIIDKGGKSL